MIKYTEKGNGLHLKIQSLGYNLLESNGVWVSDSPVEVQAIIDSYSLDEVRELVITSIDALAKEKRNAVVANVSPAEMASWAIKQSQANAFEGTDKSAPFLAAEASARGVPTSVIVDKVLAKSTQLSYLEAAISGISGKHCDAVKTLQSFEEINSYDFTTGWPI